MWVVAKIVKTQKNSITLCSKFNIFRNFLKYCRWQPFITFKKVFKTEPLINFWLQCHKEYPSVSEKAIQCLIPFVTTYMCETACSTLVYIKNKYQNKLDVKSNLRIKLTSLSPNLKLLCDEKHHSSRKGQNI